MAGAGSPETPSSELRRLSAADTEFRKFVLVLAGSLWVLGFALVRALLALVLLGQGR